MPRGESDLGSKSKVSNNKYRDWRNLRGDDVTPFTGGTLEQICEEFVSLPKIGEPYDPRGVKVRNGGESFQQMREYLIPVIVSLFEKGYTRDMVMERLTERLNVGKSNRFVKRLIYDSHQKYMDKHFKT